MLDLAVAIPTLAGSVRSMFAAGFIFSCYLVLPAQKHFRHTLIMNLAAADFLNALNNTTSGIYALKHRSIPAGVGCTLNGLIGQVRVQATDFAILFIAVATVITIRRFNYEPRMKATTKFLITLGIWFVPMTTSFTALALDDYKPVSGNWCWLSSQHQELRYTLAHGWRIAIITTIIGLYIYLFVYIHRHFSSLRKIAKINEPTGSFFDRINTDTDTDQEDGRQKIYIFNEFEMYTEPLDSYWKDQLYEEKTYYTFPSPAAVEEAREGLPEPPPSPFREIKQIIHPHLSEESRNDELDRRPSDVTTSPLLTRDPLAIIRRAQPAQLISSAEALHSSTSTLRTRERLIQKLLFLNGCPIGYVILWIPGLANRFAELNGQKSRTLAIMQASTQFVGLANALIYGYNERILNLAAVWWKLRSSKMRLRIDGFKTRIEKPSTTPIRNPSITGRDISRQIPRTVPLG